jgi:hypothetical protein
MTVIYFIQKGEGGPIKIGMTTNLKKRRAAIQTHSDEKVILLAQLDGGARRENEIHSMFEQDRKHGEWFRPSEKLLEYVASIQEETSNLSPAAVAHEGPIIIQDCDEEPIRIRDLLKYLPGRGTIIISGKTPNRALQPLKETGWREITDEDLPKVAAEHQDIWYRVSLRGKNRRHMIYTREPSVLVI